MSQTQLLRFAVDAAKAGNTSLARTQLQKAAEVAPDDPSVWLWMGWLADSPLIMVQCLETVLQIEQSSPAHQAVAEAGLVFARAMAGFRAASDGTVSIPEVVRSVPVAAPAAVGVSIAVAVPVAAATPVDVTVTSPVVREIEVPAVEPQAAVVVAERQPAAEPVAEPEPPVDLEAPDFEALVEADAQWVLDEPRVSEGASSDSVESAFPDTFLAPEGSAAWRYKRMPEGVSKSEGPSWATVPGETPSEDLSDAVSALPDVSSPSGSWDVVLPQELGIELPAHVAPASFPETATNQRAVEASLPVEVPAWESAAHDSETTARNHPGSAWSNSAPASSFEVAKPVIRPAEDGLFTAGLRNPGMSAEAAPPARSTMLRGGVTRAAAPDSVETSAPTQALPQTIEAVTLAPSTGLSEAVDAEFASAAQDGGLWQSAIRSEVVPSAGSLGRSSERSFSPDDSNTGNELVSERQTILVVDDSPTVRKLVAMTLEKVGFRVVAAFDGVAAIKEIAAHNPALILMDVNMPRLDGYQLCKLVKKHESTQHIPVLMLSGKDGMFDRLRGRLVGCAGYISKPFVPEALIETVEQHLAAAVQN